MTKPKSTKVPVIVVAALAELPATGEPAAKKQKPPRTVIHRPSSDASRFHMSKAAVDRSVQVYAKWSDEKCIKHLALHRWGSSKRVGCPHCNTTAEHYWHAKESRWKCGHCGKKFSVTSKSVFAWHKISLQTLLAAIHLWACGAAGQPALELRRMLNLGGYNTSFTLISKLREGLLRGFNTGLISGVVEMDGAHASGRRASIKRGRPLTFRLLDDDEARDEALLTTSAKQKKRREQKQADIAAGGIEHPEHGMVHPASRRMAITLRRRSGVPGKGALVTRVGIGLTESPEVTQSLVDSYVAIPESILATDSGTAFKGIGKQFKLHVEVNHSETLVGPNGEHCNNSEGFTARQDRSENGVYLNIEPKYLHDYVVETAFREDTRRLAPGAIADRALYWALNVGSSQFWRGYTHGKHRDFEILRPANRFAAASGPKPGRSPLSQVNGRPPR